MDNKTNTPKKLYRYEGRRIDDFCYKLRLDEYRIIRETPHYFVIDQFCAKDKYVKKEGKKLFAFPTEEKALESFIARKKIQMKILKGQLRGAEILLGKAEKLQLQN